MGYMGFPKHNLDLVADESEPNVCEAPSSVERSVYPVLCEVCKIRGGIKMTVKCDRKSCYHCVL